MLSGGENIEPEPIENSVLRSPLVQQVMLVGQDRKTLGALVVPEGEGEPDEAALRAELRARTGPPAGFRSFEAVNRFAIVREPFSFENGLLTQTLKFRRHAITERYAAEIEGMFEER